jgi:hypothetical protein
MVWFGICPPPSEYSCACFSNSQPIWTTGTNVPAREPVPSEVDILVRDEHIAALEARIKTLEDAFREVAVEVDVKRFPDELSQEERELVAQKLREYVDREIRQSRCGF